MACFVETLEVPLGSFSVPGRGDANSVNGVKSLAILRRPRPQTEQDKKALWDHNSCELDTVPIEDV